MRVYTSTIETVSTGAAKTLSTIQNPSDQVCQILEAHVVAPDDDTNEQLDIAFQKITSLGTPTGTAVTPTKHMTGSPAAGVTTTMDITASEPTYGAANVDVIGRQGASSLGGWHYQPPRGAELTLSPGENWGLRLLTAPGTSKTLTVQITFAEIGG